MNTNEKTREIANELGLEVVELAQHWSGLYEHDNGYAVGIVISDEDAEKAVEDMNGIWVIAKRRDGEHHSTYSQVYNAEEGKEKLSKEDEGNMVYESFEDYFSLREKLESVDTFEELKELYEEAAEEMRFFESAIWTDGKAHFDHNGARADEPGEYGCYEDVYSYSLVFIPEFEEEINEEEE